MKSQELGRSAISACVVVVMLAACGGSAPVGATGAMQQAAGDNRVYESSSSSGYCPANPSGSGILPDGDFSQALNPGDGFIEPYKGTVFALGWEVAKRSIDFNGSTFWNVGGFCSVDLDGNSAGGIVTSAFRTERGAAYVVTFILSGNGGQGKGNPPVVKTMKIQAASQFATFTWNTANDNDAEHGKYAERRWKFQALSSLTVLQLISQDPKASSRGAVVAAIAAERK